MCGIVGIMGTPQASSEAYQALQMLQHRGQDSAGILSVDSESGKFHLHKELGQVSQVFTKENLQPLTGNLAIGHTRYSTIGKIKSADLQPMAISLPVGMGMVHNGNVSNYQKLKQKLVSRQRIFMSDNDLEIILHSMAESFASSRATSKTLFQSLCLSVQDVLETTEGGFSVIGLLGTEGLFAFRDPHGIRPLVLGQRTDETGQTAFCLTSETCALKFLGYEVVRDLQPGELIWIDSSRKPQFAKITQKAAKPCMFEWIYFSSADSTLEGINVYEARLDLGKRLANRIPASILKQGIDLVAPVPDTSRPAAIGLAETLGLPFREVLIKNRYVQRSFILNGQDLRKLAVKMKFSVVDELVRGKNILLVDDSIVRGTTSKKLIELLKQQGAARVYLASTCPPIHFPCFYGIDFPNPKDLIAHEKNSTQIAEALGADGVFFTTSEDLSSALRNQGFCDACLTGNYAYPVQTPSATGEVNREANRL
jgi:amidophosphoribosyltransferase